MNYWRYVAFVSVQYSKNAGECVVFFNDVPVRSTTLEEYIAVCANDVTSEKKKETLFLQIKNNCGRASPEYRNYTESGCCALMALRDTGTYTCSQINRNSGQSNGERQQQEQQQHGGDTATESLHAAHAQHQCHNTSKSR